MGHLARSGRRTPAVLTALLVALLTLTAACGGGDPPAPATTAATPATTVAPAPAQTDRLDPLPTADDYAASIAAPMDRLAASAGAVASTLGGAGRSGDTGSLNTTFAGEGATVEAARADLAAIEPGTVDASAAHEQLLTAVGHHRRYLTLLASATGGAPTRARIEVLSRARAEGATALEAYRRFFAAVPIADRITTVGLVDTAALDAAMTAAVEAAEAPAAPVPDGTDGFSSPTGNLRCLYRVTELLCSSANDNFLAALPESGGPITTRGTVDGGPALAYGATWNRGAFSCRSQTDGITCENASGNGFFLSRDEYFAF